MSTTVSTVSPTRSSDHVADLIERHFGRAGDVLTVGGISVAELAKRHGTPLFVYDQNVLLRQWRLLRETYPEKFKICYSVKANPNQAFLRFFVSLGCGLEIASSGELVQALAAGCPARDIYFAGPGKTEAELRLAVDHGIGEVHVESLVEARRLAAIAGARNRRVRIALRVNPTASVEGGGMRMGAKPVPFGIDEDQLDDVLAAIQHEEGLDVVGLHLFMGTQITDHEVLLCQYGAGLKIAHRLAKRLGRPLETVDFGGGLGVPYFAHESRLDMDQLRSGLEALVESAERYAELQSTTFIVEPGRFLAAEAGVYLVAVSDVKVSRGKKFVITDGGMHHHLAASGNLGQTIKRNFPVAAATRLGAPPSETVDIVGPLCTPLDVLARGIELPRIEVGDLLAVFQSGAYARAASPLNFLSRPFPAEVMIDGDARRLIRRRGTEADYLADQV